MPQLGETVAEGKITKWFKSAGDAVKPGDNLFEIETDKTSMEVPATFAGTLTDIRFQVGETAKVGAVVAVIAGSGRAADAAKRCRCSQCARHKLRSRPRKRADPARARRAGSPLARGRADAASLSPIRTWIRSARCARPSAISDRPKLRAAPSSRRWRAGSPASAASIFRASRLRPARPHRRRDVETRAAVARPRCVRRAPVRRR